MDKNFRQEQCQFRLIGMSDISFSCPNCRGSINVPGEMANQLMECPTCNETIEVPVRTRGQTPPASISFVADASENESIFFQSEGILVTNARFVVGTKTFAIRSITSVELIKANQDMERSGTTWDTARGIAAFVCFTIMMLGLILWLGFDFSFWIAIASGIVGFAIWHVVYLATIQTKPIFRILLKTAGGDVTAYQSIDREHISQITQALNNSIISQA